MIKNIVILVGSSLVFDLLFGTILISKPDLFEGIKGKVPNSGIRHLYKLLFFIVIVVTVLSLNNLFKLNEIVVAVILGFSISLSGIIFSKHRKQIKK